MTTIHDSDDEQATLWNGVAGHAWVAEQPLLDRLYAELEAVLVDAVPAGFEGRVLDVGCGTGSTTLAIARRLGPGGRCIGIDISQPMVALARSRAEQQRARAEFIRANAQEHAFETASVDRIVSRFGVMFFNNPVAAFANLRRAAIGDAGIRLVVWRAAAENPFMTAAERAAAPLLPTLPPRRAGAPGQFAFADPQRVRGVLDQSGWTAIEIRPIDAECVLPESELVGYFTSLGPVGLALQQADEMTRARVIETVRPAFDGYVQGADVRFTAACWLIDARAGG
jgi:SAM-dependent methyltransferase